MRRRNRDENNLYATIPFDRTSEQFKYMQVCARNRDISITALFKRIIDDVAKEQLVAGVLDDEDDLLTKRRGEHPYRDI